MRPHGGILLNDCAVLLMCLVLRKGRDAVVRSGVWWVGVSSQAGAAPLARFEAAVTLDAGGGKEGIYGAILVRRNGVILGIDVRQCTVYLCRMQPLYH